MGGRRMRGNKRFRKGEIRKEKDGRKRGRSHSGKKKLIEAEKERMEKGRVEEMREENEAVYHAQET